MAKNHISPQTQQEAMAIAKGTQRPGQTKEQTRLIAQGIEKGISEYKKREKQKARERDKQRKKELNQQNTQQDHNDAPIQANKSATGKAALPWILLIASWLVFITFYLWTGAI